MKIICATQKDNKDLLLNEMCDVWNSVVTEQYFLKPFTHESYKAYINANVHFDFDFVYLAYEDEKLVGFVIGVCKQGYKDNPNYGGYFNSIAVLKEYRGKGIGTSLLKAMEDKMVSFGHKTIYGAYFLPNTYSWYIPNTDKHDHPCTPGIRVNSPEYIFLINNGYDPYTYQHAFHLNLSEYNYPESVSKILEKNAKDGIKIELYDPKKHFGLEEFYADVKAPDFEKCIRSNLELEKPYPFLVVSENGAVKGWTGAFWNEESGRGHFDGIIISESLRGRGLGKALFASLAYYSKQNGAKFMTFYTGWNNDARYVYLGAGFKIAQTFAVMKKVIK